MPNPKTGASRRVIPLPATVTAALCAHLRACPPGPAGLLFTTPRERAQPGELAAADLAAPDPVRSGHPAGTTFHYLLRHAYASLLGDAALPDHDIQLRLGHADPGEIRWYRHPYPGPGEGQATRDAIDTALSAREDSALAC